MLELFQEPMAALSFSNAAYCNNEEPRVARCLASVPKMGRLLEAYNIQIIRCIYKLSHRLFFHALQHSCQKNDEIDSNFNYLSGPRHPSLPAKPEERGCPPVPLMAAAAKPALHEPEHS